MNFPKTIIIGFASVLFSSAFLLSEQATAQVDLVLENGFITYNSTTHELTVTVDIKNAGAGDTPPFAGFRVGCYLSTDTVVDGKDYEFTYFSMSYGMFAGEVYKQKSTGAVDLDSYTNAPSGTYYVLLKTDAQSQITETNENNNTLKCGTVVYNTATGIKEEEKVQFKLFPNPTTGKVTLNPNGADIKTISVCNVLGEVLLQQPFSHPSETYNLELGNNFPAGLYIISINTEDKVYRQKLIKQ